MTYYRKIDTLTQSIDNLNLGKKIKTKPVKADTTILGNKTLLKWFRKFINTSTNENTDILEYQISELKAPCLPFSMILEEFHF